LTARTAAIGARGPTAADATLLPREEALVDARRSQRLLDPLFTTEAMRAIFSDHGRVQAMLDFEAALARAEARAGLFSAAAAAAIGAQCRAERFDLDALAAAAAQAGNAAIPLVQALTAQVAASDAEAARFVHWGATSQDAIDTGLVLQLRSALAAIASDLARLSTALAALAERHAKTVLAGRTWLQQGPPVTLGLKVAGTLSALERHRVRLASLRGHVATLQFGGAVGTLAALGAQGFDVAEALADELELELPDMPWHAQRDRLAEVATTLGLLVGTLGKFARDLSLLMQTEVGEVSEPAAPGRGGSSTMPHKRNPVGSAVILAAAARIPALVSVMLAAMVQEHERGLGGWHAEWETLPEICTLSAGALAQTIVIIEGIEVDPARMAANVDRSGGLILAEAVTMALGAKLGRMKAHQLLEDASATALREGKHLREVLATDAQVSAHLSPADLDRLLDPKHYVGQAERMVARVLAARRKAGDGATDA
jgi:3-carboxy-cis,cis-muconate cycloisomerase